jgi:D-xylose transport system substrate-binding protein
MILVDYNGAAVAVTQKAQKQDPGHRIDRPITTGFADAPSMLADYYVSFDNEKVGRLEGQSIVDGPGPLPEGCRHRRVKPWW